MKLVGCKSSFFPIREASQGTSVNPTSKLVRVEVITTIENCLSISATNTCKTLNPQENNSVKVSAF